MGGLVGQVGSACEEFKDNKWYIGLMFPTVLVPAYLNCSR